MIVRGSQPLVGANKKRCREDELLLQAVINGSDKGYVIDTRSSQQVQRARMTGGGFESKSSYDRWKRLHKQMERCAQLEKILEVDAEYHHPSLCANISHDLVLMQRESTAGESD